MKHAPLIAALAVLAACAATPAADTGDDPELAFALGHDLSCNAREFRRDDGPPMETPISLHVPDRGGTGRFCMATGCEDAQYEPTLTRALGWTAIMRTDDRSHYNAELEISRDLRTFTLSQAGERGVSTWNGSCQAAGS